MSAVAADRPAGTADATAKLPGRRLLVRLVMLGLVAFGLYSLAHDFGPTVRKFGGPAAVATVLAVITVLVGFWLLRLVQPVVRTSRRKAILGLAWGAAGAIGCAIVANGGLKAIWARSLGVPFASSWGDALTAPINEEWLKAAGLVLLTLAFSAYVRTPMEGFVCGAFVGFGFQFVENWTYAINGVMEGGGTSGVLDVIQSFVGRVLITGIGSHWTMTAVAGTGIGFLLNRRWLPGAGLVLIAMAMHWQFDSPLLPGAAGSVVKTLVNFVVAAAVYVLLRRRFRADVAARFTAAGGDPRMLRSRSRRRVLHENRDRAGRRAVRRDTQTELHRAVEQSYQASPAAA